MKGIAARVFLVNDALGGKDNSTNMWGLSKYSQWIGRPPIELLPGPSVWLFVQWVINLVDPMPRFTGQGKWIIVSIDYFWKWIDAKALASTTKFEFMKFFKSTIESRYGVPHILVKDNGSQFTGRDIKWFLEELNIEHWFESIRHAQISGTVGATNMVVRDCLKKARQWP